MHQYLHNYREICLNNDVNNYSESCVDLIKSSSEPIDTTNWSSCLDDAPLLDEYTNLFTDVKTNKITDGDVRRLFSSPIVNRTNKTKHNSSNKKDAPPKILWNNVDFSDLFTSNEEDSESIKDSIHDTHEIQCTNKIDSNNILPKSPKIETVKPTEYNINSLDVEKKPKFEFRTGREELIAQNSIKYGNTINSSLHGTTTYQKPFFAYGAVKKSLGGRRNVQSKFIPPFLQSSE